MADNKAQTNEGLRKLIIVDHATVKYTSLTQWLKKDGIVAEGYNDLAEVQKVIKEGSYHACILQLGLANANPFELIRTIKKDSKNKDLKVIVISRQVHKQNIHNAIQAGAADFVAEPFEMENLYQRLIYHLAPKQVLELQGLEKSEVSREAWSYLQKMLEANEALSHIERGKEYMTFYSVLKSFADLVESNRTSLMIVDEENNSGQVLASSDDPNFHDFPVSLDKYPEILHVVHTGQFVLIEDAAKNSLTKDLQQTVQTINIGSLMVFPIRFQNEVVGTLTIRRPKATAMPPKDALRILQAVANTLAAHSNIKLILKKIYQGFKPKAA